MTHEINWAAVRRGLQRHTLHLEGLQLLHLRDQLGDELGVCGASIEPLIPDRSVFLCMACERVLHNRQHVLIALLNEAFKRICCHGVVAPVDGGELCLYCDTGMST